jgi:hypothetical protein
MVWIGDIDIVHCAAHDIYSYCRPCRNCDAGVIGIAPYDIQAGLLPLHGCMRGGCQQKKQADQNYMLSQTFRPLL